MDKSGARKWIVSFFAAVLAVMLVCAGAAYLIDPFFQFRVRDNAYMLRGWFVDSGLIENYDYDTLIVGSSMTQNFDMDLFREELGVKPLHVGMGGIKSPEVLKLMNAAYEAHRANKYYVCIDQYMFTGGEAEDHYPEYLFRKDILSRLRYLLSYEVWFRYIPVDIVFMALDALGVDLPLKYQYNKSIDRLEDWRLDFPAAMTGQEAVLRNYRSGQYSVSEVDTENLYERMKENIDLCMESFRFEEGKHVFFFPPYSSLFWCGAQDSGYFSAYLLAKQYFTEQAMRRGAEVYDFQSAELTADLNNYRDTTHYLPPVNDWMVRCFAGGEYLVTAENFGAMQEKLKENTVDFRNQLAELAD